MANEKREQRKKERQVRRTRKADERAGILTAMDAKRAELSKTPPEEISTPEPEKSGKVNIRFGRLGSFDDSTIADEGTVRTTYVAATGQPSKEEAQKTVKAQEELLKKSGWKEPVRSKNIQSFSGTLDSRTATENGTWTAYSPLQEPVVGQDPTAVNIPTAGSTLLDAVSKGDGTIGELNKAVDDAKTANQEEIQTKNQLTGIADQAAKLITEEEQQGQTEEKTLPGDGKTLAGQKSMQVERGARPKFDQVDTKEDIRSKILEKNKDIIGDASKAVVENLATEDYYPNIRKDIAVGTYQGRYLGSATIFAAPGARVPLGLYDARQRALKEAAQQKQKQIEDILSVPETSPQYQALYNEKFYDMLESELERLDYDFDAFSTDIQALRNMARFKAKAKEITESVTFADSILKAGAEDATYTPQEMIDLSQEIKYAQINNLDAILAGEANAVEPLKKAQIYKDLVPEVQDLAKDLLNPDRMGQSPINLRTGGKYDSPAWINERNQFFDKVASGIGWDEYATGIVKYFGGDYETMIENLVKGRGGSEDQVEPMKKMFASMIQNQTILSYKTVNNDEVRVMELRESQRQFNINREDKMNNFWGNINGGLGDQQPTDINGKPIDISYNEALRQAQSIKDETKRAQRLKEIAYKYQVGSVSFDPNNKTYVYTNDASPTLAAAGARPQQLTTASGHSARSIRVEVPVGEGFYKTEYFSPSQLSDYKGTIIVGGKKYNTSKQSDKAELKKWGEIKGTVWTKTISTESRKGYTDQYGREHYLDADGKNLEEYNNSKNKFVYTTPIEKPFIRREEFDKVLMKTTYIDEELPGIMVGPSINISSKENQQGLNNQWGYNTPAAAGSISEGGTVNYSGSSTTR